ncbi:AAA family ATPase [Paracoccus benzoatiresistens]|uniref:AAA family ATPase n=1 Tax=Paracoccus benzoatiresistens TaxID=2997341 RepID=A0ABT4J5S5_9RHOB|nr:AAA family ATPase [Paracoccus sp. EF6]MCZ0962463.1 AAA family ATPase [Paracoccus sp. EF6]
MTTHDTPAPSWRTYADMIIGRLEASWPPRTNLTGRTGAGTPGDADDDPDARDDLLALRARLPGPSPTPAAADARCDGDGDSDADPQNKADHADARPRHRLPSHWLSLAIRLAATPEIEEAMQNCSARRTITLITGFAAGELDLATRLIRKGMFTPDQSTTTEPCHLGPEDTVILLAPGVRDGEISRGALAGFHDRISHALDRTGGLILLVPDNGALPAGMAEAAPTVLRLAPLGREVMIAHLRHSHSEADPVDEAALRGTLPEDHLLASLPPAMLRLALRASSATAVAEHLARLCQPPSKENPDLDAMAGDSAALTAARRLVADLRLWQNGTIQWSELSRSLLLYGPPGTGKTWLARAMGNAAGITLIEASFAAWQSAGHLGDMLREMRKSFAEARRLAPAVLFIDEIDAVGSRDDADTHGSRYHTQVVNGFLAEMDSIAREEGVLVIGACNHVTRIDPAVLRPGRFDLKIPMPLPDAATIHGILKRHLGGEIGPEVLRELATAAVGQSAANIDAAVRAARSDARHGKGELSVALLRRHLDIGTEPAQARVDWRVSVHECGHAIAATLFGCGRVTRILLTPEGGEIHRRLPQQEGLLQDLEAQIAYSLAGRVAEGLVLGRLSAGAGGSSDSDLALATRLALHIEMRLGLGEDGPIWINAPEHELLRDPRVRARVRQRLEAAEGRAARLLTAHEPLLRAMATALQQQRELSGSELDSWLHRIAATEASQGERVVERPRLVLDRSASASGERATHAVEDTVTTGPTAPG